MDLLHDSCNWPIDRKTLGNFAEEVHSENPGITFDFSLMDQFEHPDCWVIDILTDEKLKKKLYSWIKDRDDME